MAKPEHQEVSMLLVFGTLSGLAFLALFSRCICCFAQVKAGFAWACTWAARGCRPAEPHDTLWHLVCEELLKKKVGQYRCLMHVLSLMGLLTTLNITWNIITEQQRWQSMAQDAVTVALSLLVVLPCIRPSFITARSLDLHYLCTMACLSVYSAPFAVASPHVMPSLFASNTAVAMLNLTRRNVPTRKLPLYFLANSCFLLSASGTILLRGSDHFSSGREAVLMQAVVAALFALGAYSLEGSFAATLRQGLQFEEAREVHFAACALLRSFCECTVELDSEGVISGPAQDLGSFLMKGSFSYCLQGKRLAELLEEPDAALLEERLRCPRMQRFGLAEMLPVQARDACGNSLRLELLWFDFRKVDGRRHFMVGVRELTDCRRGDCGELPADDNAGVELEESVEESFSEPNAAVLVVNAMEEGFPILGQSRGLVAQLGRLPRNMPLSNFVKRPELFLPWVQAAALEEQPAKAQVTLVLPWGRFKAQCSVVVGAEDLEALGLVFTDIAPQQRCRQGQGRGTPHTPSSCSSHIASL